MGYRGSSASSAATGQRSPEIRASCGSRRTMKQGLWTWLISKAVRMFRSAVAFLEQVWFVPWRSGNMSKPRRQRSTRSQSHSPTMPQVDSELANFSESVWSASPFLRPTAGRYSLQRCGDRWSWAHGGFKVDVSSCEAEEAIAGKMITSLGRMWSDIRIEQLKDESVTIFIVTCRGDNSSIRGSGRSPAMALLDAWITDAD